MSFRRPAHLFGRSAGHGLACAALLAAAVWLPGCASVSIEEAVPAGALATDGQDGATVPAATAASTEATLAGPSSAVAPAAQPVAPGSGASAPRDTGVYPNMNIPRQAAADQLSASETAARSSALRSAAAQQEQGTTATTAKPSDMEALRRLRATHASETLKQIEGE